MHMYLDNFYNPTKLQGQRSRSRGFWGVFLWAWCCGYPRTVLSLDQGLMILFVVVICSSCRGQMWLRRLRSSWNWHYGHVRRFFVVFSPLSRH